MLLIWYYISEIIQVRPKAMLPVGRQMLEKRRKYVRLFYPQPRGGKAKEIDPADVERFLERLPGKIYFRKAGGPCTVYYECLCRKRNLRDFAREIMADDLKRMEYTPGNYYNFHPGSHVGQGTETGIDQNRGNPQ